MSIVVTDVSKQFGKFQALKDVNLEIKTGELLALLGPSGSGKTTLLRIIAGLETADAGSIHFNGEDITERHVRKRQVGFVFQHYALFRHMTVFENIAFGMRVKPRHERPTNDQIRDRVMHLLKMVQLEGLAQRHPSQLSGGQRQRVALARALAVEPQMLLLDEPFGALDARVRQELRQWLRRLHDELHVTSIFVTHDQEEALEVADRIVVMNHGQIEQIGTPEEVYDTPANPFVFNFLGSVNLFHGRVANGEAQVGAMAFAIPDSAVRSSEVVGYTRPHELEIARQRNGSPTIEAVVRHITAVGPIVRVGLDPTDGAETIAAEITREKYKELNLQVGESVHVKPKRVQVFWDDYSI
ncbi:MAG: sulfate/molybdate ABC transporter ATP-binding protein [Capsulimonas sp.]|jgi:sulfate transport system ATP-binding protein|uniref:sulfate/molybdate ABC transporter ATP-binding protein n=1 Tax=Capsulimonas sp. TaxID=2494211 RepID=UPI003262F755